MAVFTVEGTRPLRPTSGFTVMYVLRPQKRARKFPSSSSGVNYAVAHPLIFLCSEQFYPALNRCVAFANFVNTCMPCNKKYLKCGPPQIPAETFDGPDDGASLKVEGCAIFLC